MSDRARLSWPAELGPRQPYRHLVLLISVVYGTLYALTAAHTLQGGDTSELVVTVFRGGVTHPPGYPLYVGLGKVVTWLPLLNPTFTLSLLSAVFAVATLAVLYHALNRWGFAPAASAMAVCVLGVSPAFWRYAGVPEVFTLNTLMAALLLFAAGRGPGPRGWRRAGWMGLVLGLGLANHHSIILLGPVVALGLWRAAREWGWRRALPVLGIFAAALLLGLTPYLSLLTEVREGGWYWGGGLDAGGLLDHVLRREYGTLRLGLRDMRAGPFENVVAYAGLLPTAFAILLPFGLWALALAAIAPFRRRRRLDDVFDATALAGSFLLSSVAFFAFFNLRPEGLATQVIERFYLLADLLFASLCAAGLTHLLRWRRRLAVYVRPLTVGLVCTLLLANVRQTNWSDDYAVEDYLLNALDSTEPRGVILGTGELQLFGFLAAAEVLAYRTDVSYVDLNLIRRRWYYDRVKARLPELSVPFDPKHTSSVLVAFDLVRHYPVYIADLHLVPELQARTLPVGPLLRVIPPGQAVPPPEVAESINLRLFRMFQFRGAPPADRNSWGSLSFRYYERTWAAIANAYERSDHLDRAARVRALAQAYRPE